MHRSYKTKQVSQNACVVQVPSHCSLHVGNQIQMTVSGAHLLCACNCGSVPSTSHCFTYVYCGRLYPTCSGESCMGKTSVSTSSLDLSCATAPPLVSSCRSPCTVAKSRWLLGGLLLPKSTPPHRGSPLDVVLPSATLPQLLGSSPPWASEPILPSPSSLASPSAYLVFLKL